jgi:ribonuclease HI
MNDAVLGHLRELEESLWRAETRFDRAYLEGTLHPDFVEFGQSGRTYTRDEAVATPTIDFEAEIPLPHFEAHELSDDVVLITYVGRVDYHDHAVTANRASIWVRSNDRWLLRYHQGTPAPHPEENVF